MARRKVRRARKSGFTLSLLRSRGSTLLGFVLGLGGSLGGGLWYGQELVMSRPTTVYLGVPRSQPDGPAGWQRVLHNDAFAAGYSEWRGGAAWVAYRATPRPPGARGLARPDRFEHDWRTLRCLTIVACVRHEDYTGSGYDRGHLAPNHLIATRYGRKAQHQTFLMSNIVPQRPALNRGVWQRLEAAEDALSNRFGPLWVFTGPIYDARPAYLPGFKLIALPSAFYKILVREDSAGGAPRMLAFAVPQDVEGGEDLRRFLVSVADVQRWTGLDFFHQLPDAVEARVEARIDTSSWGF
ncbi:DNA/RNA non-specific endonuclease [Thauera phenolivorans]|nr:DNA/RNA non-specific endonuclease [Thauera phenolivorans]